MSATIAVTTGEPSGIGPEVSLKAAVACTTPITLIGDRALLAQTARRIGLPWPLPAHIQIDHVPLRSAVTIGKLDVANADYVLETLSRACDGALNGTYSAVATAPVQKSVITEAGRPFSGHTEFFAERSQVDRVVMMLVSSGRHDALRVALATTHLPIAQLSQAITGTLLDQIIDVLHRDLVRSFAIQEPAIAVTGLNPHAGESGHMGTEEIVTISPAIERARLRGINVSGPWPADTIFVDKHARQYDVILCMYHDQGLPVLKREGFGHGVNVTLGLPWIRTSVDHGTALDIAGQGIADAGSMLEAIRTAQYMAQCRRLPI